jgi:hypothetical protein
MIVFAVCLGAKLAFVVRALRGIVLVFQLCSSHRTLRAEMVPRQAALKTGFTGGYLAT